ncbi:MAG: 16S rRNA (cytidine(1402)-2'-O)-methyltransferase, partial [Erysipelotrichaceae bacterium]|nr:16S rRNA (cytidine(1402)-2'-O)-methyltransferase [Erysipelotrichaceae bacterium]
LLKHFDIHTKCIAHHLYNEKQSADGIVELLQGGNNVALVSDAGYPLISDPGQWLVNQVIDAGFNVVVINGPSAMLTALVASGLQTQPFTFVGFPGSSEKECRKTLEQWKDHKETLVFYEAPHRILKTLKVFLEVFGDRKACIARELTKKYEEYLRGTISELMEEMQEPKGEMVLVVEGKGEDPIATVSMSDLVQIVEGYVQSGISASEAIKRTAKEHKVSKNEIYKAYFH